MRNLVFFYVICCFKIFCKRCVGGSKNKWKLVFNTFLLVLVLKEGFPHFGVFLVLKTKRSEESVAEGSFGRPSTYSKHCDSHHLRGDYGHSSKSYWRSKWYLFDADDRSMSQLFDQCSPSFGNATNPKREPLSLCWNYCHGPFCLDVIYYYLCHRDRRVSFLGKSGDCCCSPEFCGLHGLDGNSSYLFYGICYHHLQTMEFEGFANVTMMRICSTVVSHMCVASAVVFLVYSMQRSIAAKLESGDAFSLLRGFRKVLRGVCDGDLVLDNEFQIVGDATSLEQLLKSERQLVGTNFLDLFLDIEGRQCFKQFLNAESASKQMDKMDNRDAFALPRGLRVSLQGAEGPISADVFCTRVPNGEGPDYCLLALKEDPEQHLADCAPCAPPSEGSQVFEASSTAKLGSQGSSIPEIFASAFEDLVQVALLVSNDSVGLDIEEATLSFERSPNETMPTLRKLLRGSGLERVKRACQSVCNLPEGEHHALRSPLRFRIPGAPGSSLSAERVHISVDREMPGQFWMHLSALRTSHRKERELEGIIEE